MSELDYITVKGFKSITSIEELKFGALTVLIGPNGSGKSNFLGVFSFLNAVAEGRLQAGDVLVYWIHAEPGRGSVVEKIAIRDDGEMERWPHGVFIEDYEEILAIRRAARASGQKGSAHSNR